MKIKTKLSLIFLSIISLISISNADTGYGISDIGILSSLTTGIEEIKATPVEYALNQNYPNPYNPSTEISFSLAQSSFVNMEIYNSLGQKVATLLNKRINPGQHKVKFNASNLSNGIYYYKLTAGQFQSVKKMILLQ